MIYPIPGPLMARKPGSFHSQDYRLYEYTIVNKIFTVCYKSKTDRIKHFYMVQCLKKGN